MQRGIIEAQLLQGIAQVLVVIRADRVKAGEHIRLHGLEAWQCLFRRIVDQRQGITHGCPIDILDAGNQEADITGNQLLLVQRFRCKHTQLLNLEMTTGRHDANLVTACQAAINHAYQRHHADIVIKPGIDNQHLQGGIDLTAWRRDPADQFFQDILYTLTGLGACQYGVIGIDADDLFNFLFHPFGISRWQVNLVQYRHDFEIQVNCGVAICDTLGLYPLGGIDYQQGPLTGSQ